MLIFYLILLTFYLICSVYLVVLNFSFPLLIAQIVGFVAISRLFLQELSKKFLPLYFLIERLKLRISPDTTSRWWFHARYEGILSEQVFRDLELELKKSDRFRVKQTHSNSRERFFEIDDTLFITITYTDGKSFVSEVDCDNCIDVISKTVEVSYGHAKKKLQGQIEPFLLLLEDIIRPTKHSFELNVEFEKKKNPFFNVYVANLSQSQIEDFRVVLHVDGNGPKHLSDRIEISPAKLRITAESTNSFRKLAENFILLTPDTKLLIGAKHE